MLATQLLGLLFGLGMVYINYLNYKRKEFTIKEYLFWVFFWFAFITFSLFPGILNPITETLHFARTLDLLIVAGFLFLIFALFYVYTVVRQNQKKLENLVRNLAIKKK